MVAGPIVAHGREGLLPADTQTGICGSLTEVCAAGRSIGPRFDESMINRYLLFKGDEGR